MCSTQKSKLEKLEKNSKDDQRYNIIPIQERILCVHKHEKDGKGEQKNDHPLCLITEKQGVFSEMIM